MPPLASAGVYQRFQAVDIAPVLAVLGTFRFVDTQKCTAWVTDHTAPAPEPLDAFVDGLGLGGTRMRMFCRKLMAGQGIAPHVDSWVPADQAWRRFQAPLTSHPDIVMRWPDDGVSVHLEPGWLYEVRYDRRHEVVNDTRCERVHIQIDQMGATI